MRDSAEEDVYCFFPVIHGCAAGPQLLFRSIAKSNKNGTLRARCLAAFSFSVPATSSVDIFVPPLLKKEREVRRVEAEELAEQGAQIGEVPRLVFAAIRSSNGLAGLSQLRA